MLLKRDFVKFDPYPHELGVDKIIMTSICLCTGTLGMLSGDVVSWPHRCDCYTHYSTPCWELILSGFSLRCQILTTLFQFQPKLDTKTCKQHMSHCTECGVSLAHSQLLVFNCARVRIMLHVHNVERRGWMVRTSDSQPKGRGFESRRRHGTVSVSRIPQLGVARISRIACGTYP
jgi:hypothetical protein